MKRIYAQTVIRKSLKAGVTAASLIFFYFVYLQSADLIDVTGYSGDVVCAGTEADPCYAYINFTVIDHFGQDDSIFLYPMEYDPWGRETPMTFEPGLKDWKIQRSWGKGWRTIDLYSTWSSKTKYAVKFHEGQSYEVRIIGYKENAFEDIKWGFGDVDPVFLGIKKEDVFKKLISSKAELTYGEAIFELNNPFEQMPAKQLTQEFVLAKGRPVESFEVLINKTASYDAPVYKKVWTKQICVYNFSDNPYDKDHPYTDGEKFDCSHNISVFDHNETKIKEVWVQIKEIPSGTHKIKIVAYWGAHLGPQLIDWIPTLTVAKELSGAKDDISLRQDRWAWWNSSWSRCNNVTINSSHIDTVLTNFKVNVKLSSSNVNYSLIGSNDIRFVNTSCNNGGGLIDFEIENWNESSYSIAWAEVPSVSNTTDTVISFYSDNSGASSASNRTNTFGDWNVILHMAEIGTGNRVDSAGTVTATTNGYDGDEGVFGCHSDGCDDVLSSERLNLGDHISNEGDGVFCLSFNLNEDFNSSVSPKHIIVIMNGADPDIYFVLDTDTGVDGHLNLRAYGGSGNLASTTTQWDADTWYRACGMIDDTANNKTLWVNGVLENHMSQSSDQFDTTTWFHVGAYGNTPQLGLRGKMDEFWMLWGGIKAPAWFKADYHNLHGDLVTIGSVQTSSDVSSPTYSLNSTNGTVAGTNVEHRLKWNDDNALSGYIFEFCNGTYDGSDCGGTIASNIDSTAEVPWLSNKNAFCRGDDDSLHMVWNDANAILKHANSSDGSSWTITNVSASFGNILAPTLECVGDDILYAGATDGTYSAPTVWRSTDNGASWTNITGTIASERCHGGDIEAAGSRVYYSCDDDLSTTLDLFISTDNGTTWDSGTVIMNVSGKFFDHHHILLNGTGTASDIIHAVADTAGGGGTDAIWYVNSTDGGSSWGINETLMNQTATLDYPSLAFNESNLYAAASASGGGIVYTNSTDAGGTWTSDAYVNKTAAAHIHGMALSTNENGYPIIVYEDGSDNLAWFEHNGTAWSSATTIVGTSKEPNTKSAYGDSTYEIIFKDNSDNINYTTYKGTAGWTNDSFVTMTGSQNWSNVTKKVDSDVGDWIAWKVYANDSSDNWNSSLEYNYNTTASGDTCDYTSGNFTITCSENCTVDTAYDIGGNWLITTGSGMIYVAANITNFSTIQISDGCALNLSTGIKVGG